MAVKAFYPSQDFAIRIEDPDGIVPDVLGIFLVTTEVEKPEGVLNGSSCYVEQTAQMYFRRAGVWARVILV